MAVDALTQVTRTRSNSGSTLRPQVSNEDRSQKATNLVGELVQPFRINLSVHNDTFSRESVLFAESCLVGTKIQSGDLVEISQLLEATEVRDFEAKLDVPRHYEADPSINGRTSNVPTAKVLCLVKTAPAEHAAKQHQFEVSIHRQIASSYGFITPSRVVVEKASKQKWTSSHAEICFRDAYLSRSDMWRFASQELVGQVIYAGQKLSFLNSLKATVRNIHIDNKHARMAYFDNTTVPIFRSEAARYVIFIQMSREMWDFASEGDGEILFNRVVNGFLPELFKRWTSMEVRHLVSIVMFGRLEYRRSDIVEGQGVTSVGLTTQSPAFADTRPIDHQDFYRVVVTDMASAQWTTILEELKKDFRVFLRDVLLFKTPDAVPHTNLREKQEARPVRITGRLSGSLKGNVLEAISLAASQFSNDYVDRDLIRTGISTVIVTAGSGVFDVDRDLLKLTSETLTNNGIGIDVVCLSRMPLHSVPLFRYRLPESKEARSLNDIVSSSNPTAAGSALPPASLPDLSSSPAFSSTNASVTYFSRFPSAFPARLPQIYGYGIPQWIDLSYWSSEAGQNGEENRRRRRRQQTGSFMSDNLFVPRVRMYELQMMGLMELGMADIAIPYLSEGTAESRASPRKLNSRVSNAHYSQSLSGSPEMKRKNPTPSMRTQGGLGPRHLDQGGIHCILARMDTYDELLYETEQTTSTATEKGRSNHSHRQKKETHIKKLAPPQKATDLLVSQLSAFTTKNNSKSDSKLETESISSKTSKASRPARAPRNFSYSLKGLMPFKASAVTAEVRTENINAQNIATNTIDDSSDESRPRFGSRAGTVSRISKTDSILDDERDSRPSTANNEEEGSKPIKIRAFPGSAAEADSLAKQLWQQQRYSRHQNGLTERADNTSDIDDQASDGSDVLASVPSSVPRSNISYVCNVNASNPLKRKAYNGTFGRWQHLYPRKPRAAAVKWRSLCSPASIPLTIETFPTEDEIENDYDKLCHSVLAPDADGPPEKLYLKMHALFLEMISMRIAHGYQFVVGEDVSRVMGENLADCYSICRQDAASKPRLVVVLSMANTIQKLELYDQTSIHVTKYVQKEHERALSSPHQFDYSPYVRTILSNDYFPRQFTLRGFTEQYPWELADNHLNDGGDKSENVVEQLRSWRARFVLLPVEPPASTRRMHLQDENEEEIHLLGIRALTQLWQKSRYISSDDRRLVESRMGSARRREETPLEVKMETLNPSELVSLELDRLAQIEEGSENEFTQLLPEPQKLDNETPMAKIAQMMQGEQGIEIKNRRWHLRLHYNCFHGEEFTNWLLHNVKNLENRDEAVGFGNHLMKEGLFEHVNGRHAFKDGHYFYSIKQQYRQFRPDLNRSWFSSSRQMDRPIPPTPSAEKPAKELSPFTTRTRSGSNIAQQLHATPGSEHKPVGEKRQKTISLSSMIRVNVATRKKSFLNRPEVVHIHYDRFHNPENCYHLELNWLTTTCKLVDDAIGAWANTAERYGLKLVEVPIAEAVDVPISEPFRAPYRIKLVIEPPKHKANNIAFNPLFFSATSFAPHPPANAGNADKHIYQKAILKRSNFVLDLEAASEFPEGVEIQYSWGQLDYKYTQFIHRSGVCLAQIVDNGDIMLLANRLYNSRSVNTKEAPGRMFDPMKDAGPQNLRPAVPPTAAASMQASGIIGVNLASPHSGGSASPGLNPVPNLGALTSPSPALRPSSGSVQSISRAVSDTGKPVTADTFGSNSAFAATGLWNTWITPEQIKDDLEAFCLDKIRLEAFYREVANAPIPVSSGPGSGSRKTTGSSSSSLLRPVTETSANDITSIPVFELPESVTAIRELRRPTVAYDSVNDILDRSRIGSRNGSVGSAGNGEGNGRGPTPNSGAIASPPRKGPN